jgi:hypothetical protein
MNSTCKDDFSRFKFLFKSNKPSLLQINKDTCYDKDIINYDVILYKSINDNINDLLEIIDKCLFYMKNNSLFIIENINTKLIDIIKNHLSLSIQKTKNMQTPNVKLGLIGGSIQ